MALAKYTSQMSMHVLAHPFSKPIANTDHVIFTAQSPPINASCSKCCSRGEFFLFAMFPVDIRQKIWRKVAMSPYQQRKILQVCIMPTLSPCGMVSLQLVPTPRLQESTLSTHNFIAPCAEARSEVLNYLVLVPEALPLQGDGILRCSLSRDLNHSCGLVTKPAFQLNEYWR